MELLRQTWSNLAANKLRSFLTMFGIMWGVISIVLLSAVGEGFQRGNQHVLEELGRNVVIIRNGRTAMQAGGARAGRTIRLDIQDVRLLAERSRLLEDVSPELMRGAVKAKSPFNASTLQLSGIWPSFQRMRTIEVDRGRLISEMDCHEGRRVLVIGSEASRQLFAERDPVGSELSLNGIPYTVIGRIRKKDQDSNYTGADNERLFLPYEAARADFPMTTNGSTADSLSAIIAAPRAEVARQLQEWLEREGIGGFLGLEAQGPVETDIRSVLGPRHGFDPGDPEALSMWNTAIESVMFGKMIGAMHTFFVWVSLITLALGGIGVMNIMLVAVKERTREIGIRKATGATSRNVQWQFFSEGFSLTLLSGVMGYAVGYGLCALVNLAPMPERFSGMVTTWQTTVLAIGVLTLIGVAASTYPARRAAALTPIEALRYEM
ncbi:MAG TPA: ABC transporter permease [Vicinamibacterales bacterium]|jgi:putative ABC transport system permease protein